MQEMDRELNNVIEDLDHAVCVEVLRLADATSKVTNFNLSIVDPQGFGVGREGVEQEVYSGVLSPSKRAITANSAVWTHPPISSQSNHGLGRQ